MCSIWGTLYANFGYAWALSRMPLERKRDVACFNWLPHIKSNWLNYAQLMQMNEYTCIHQSWWHLALTLWRRWMVIESMESTSSLWWHASSKSVATKDSYFYCFGLTLALKVLGFAHRSSHDLIGTFFTLIYSFFIPNFHFIPFGISFFYRSCCSSVFVASSTTSERHKWFQQVVSTQLAMVSF